MSRRGAKKGGEVQDQVWKEIDGAPAKISQNISTAQKTVVNSSKKIGRNDPCPCGSGLKYKNCCGKNV